VIPPKINPRKLPYPEVLGSISITKRKNQLISPNGFMCKAANKPAKKIRKLRTWDIFLKE
jgi:hypothetical protein